MNNAQVVTKDGLITKQLADLDNTIGRLRASIQTLEERLRPVLNQEGIEGGADCKAPLLPCPLAEVLYGYGNILISLECQVNRIVSKIEL